MKSYCLKCNQETNQDVLHEEKVKDHDETGFLLGYTVYQIIRCAGCGEISFRKFYDDKTPSNPNDNETIQELFPPRGKHSRSMKKFRGLPPSVQSIYKETIEAYNSNLGVICAIGIRSTIEVICADKGIKNGTVKSKKGKEYISDRLDGKISGLAEQGFLDSKNANCLHQLRFLGNEAAHELSKPSVDILELAIGIIEPMIDTIYSAKYKAMLLERNRKGKEEKEK